jgi:hypothetical protein
VGGNGKSGKEKGTMKKSYSGHVKEGMYSRRGKVNEEGKGG